MRITVKIEMAKRSKKDRLKSQTIQRNLKYEEHLSTIHHLQFPAEEMTDSSCQKYDKTPFIPDQLCKYTGWQLLGS